MEKISPKRLIIGMSGASGAVLGIRMLEILRGIPEWETHLVMSDGAARTIAAETDYTADYVSSLADRVYGINDLGASVSSGTFKTEGTVVVPCSMKTAAGIACGYSENLLLRAADVTLKEGRRLVLVPRESPLSTIHLRNLLTLSEAGAVIIPPVAAYYTKPQSIEEMNLNIIGKVLDRFGIELPGFKRWE